MEGTSEIVAHGGGWSRIARPAATVANVRPLAPSRYRAATPLTLHSLRAGARGRGASAAKYSRARGRVLVEQLLPERPRAQPALGDDERGARRGARARAALRASGLLRALRGLSLIHI